MDRHGPGAQRVVEILSDRWFMLITHALLAGPKRFSELQRDIPGVSKRMLTMTLRKMERDGLLTRRVFPVVPPHTEYELTELAQTLVPHLKSLCRWATDHFAQIDEARLAYDQRVDASVRSEPGATPAQADQTAQSDRFVINK